MPRRARIAQAAMAAALVLALAGCAGDDWSTPRPATTALGAPAPGFLPTSTPSPEATVTPSSGSWAGADPAPGYRVVLLTAGDDPSTLTLEAAVRAWASDVHADLRTVSADDDPVVGIVHAMDLKPELIVSVGDALIDPLAIVAPNHLDVSFLVLGAELAEPTGNVTAVDWTGAGFRGEGLGTATHFDQASFTPERSADAVRAGTAAVLNGLTGVVLWID